MVQAKLWYTDSREQKATLEEHFHSITDTRFSPTMPWLATSSLDKIVRVWDVENVSQHIVSFPWFKLIISLSFSGCLELINKYSHIYRVRLWCRPSLIDRSLSVSFPSAIHLATENHC